MSPGWWRWRRTGAIIGLVIIVTSFLGAFDAGVVYIIAAAIGVGYFVGTVFDVLERFDKERNEPK